jgi:hypothetical protein
MEPGCDVHPRLSDAVIAASVYLTADCRRARLLALNAPATQARIKPGFIEEATMAADGRLAPVSEVDCHPGFRLEQAGIHRATAGTLVRWIPACAGTTVLKRGWS